MSARAIREFSVNSTDGTVIHGQADLPASPPGATVILVGGMNALDRDMPLGISNTDNDLLFRDLAERLNAAGLAAVRYDIRGVTYLGPRRRELDHDILRTRTTGTACEDLTAVYAWASGPEGPGAERVVFLVEGEGMWLLADLASSGAPTPDAVIGIGAPLDSPHATMRWQMVERDAAVIRSLDSNGDGRTTNEDIQNNVRLFRGGANMISAFLQRSGVWTPDDLETLRDNRARMFDGMTAQASSQPDSSPYPSADRPFASFGYWKRFILEDSPAADQFANWDTPFFLHYGEHDSLLCPATQKAVADEASDGDKYRFTLHDDRGHFLGEDVFMGPIDPAIAATLVSQAGQVAAIG